MSTSFGKMSALLVVVAVVALMYWSMSGRTNPMAAMANSMNTGAPAAAMDNTAAVDGAHLAMAKALETATGSGFGGAPDAGVMPAPLGYASYAYTDDSAYFGAYPQGEDSASLTSDGAPGDYQLSLNSLMPAGWGQSAGCGADATDGQWGKFAPTKQQFEQYITASGSARYGMNTRTQNPTGGVQGLTNLIWPVAAPVTGGEIPFNDSSFRQDLVYDSMNFYPAQAACGGL